MSQMKNTSTPIVRINRSLLLVMMAVLNYGEMSKVQYGISFIEACIKNIFNDMMPSQYLPKQLRSSYVRYGRFGLLMKKNGDLFPLLESRNNCWKDGKEQVISHLDSEVLHASRGDFVVLLIESTDFYINNPTKSMALHAPIFCRFATSC